MSQRMEFVLLARQEGVNFRALCRRFGISVKTGCKWRGRYEEGGAPALVDRLRRPRRSPKLSAPETVGRVLGLRQEHPSWGGRKLRRRLQDLGHALVPSASTCTEILRRAGLLQPAHTAGPWQRFARPLPNQLWQLDYKGHFATQSGERCHPLCMLDDCSRFNLLLSAQRDQKGRSVQQQLTPSFQRYGLPEQILCDNGPPWGTAEPTCPYTTLTVWLLRLGIQVLHGRPYHPQTQGKEERFHRTLQRELLSQHTWPDLVHCQRQFDRYRHIYNCERPHDSLGGATPVSRYQPSVRSLPPTLPPIDYPLGTDVRRVRASGTITFGGQTWYIGTCFAALPIGLRAQPDADGRFDVWFASHHLGLIDLTTPLHPKHLARSIYQRGEADRLPCAPSAQSGEGREPSPLP